MFCTIIPRCRSPSRQLTFGEGLRTITKGFECQGGGLHKQTVGTGGQCGAAQSHLANQGVGEGDVFLFFGLFAGENGARHHRIFGWLEAQNVEPIAAMAPERR